MQPENIIFNPLIYGKVTFEKNVYGNIGNDNLNYDDNVDFNIDAIFNQNIYINDKSKIKIRDDNNSTIHEFNSMDLFNVTKVQSLTTGLNDLTTNLTTGLNNLTTDLNDLTTGLNDLTNGLNDLTTDYTKYKNINDEAIKEIKNKCLNFVELNNDINIEKLEKDIYLILNKNTITLPSITNSIIGKKATFINCSNNDSKILANDNNTICSPLLKNNNVFLLRKSNTINVIAINLTTWLFF